MFALLFAYFQFFAPSPAPSPKEEVKKEQAVAKLTKTDANQQQSLPDTSKAIQQEVVKANTPLYGNLAPFTVGTPKTYKIENENLSVKFSNQGAALEEVLLKSYKTWDGKPLLLFEKGRSAHEVILPSNQGSKTLGKLFFAATQTDSSIDFTAGALRVRYVLSEKAYEVKQIIDIGPELSSQSGNLAIQIGDNLPRSEKDLASCRVNATTNYYSVENGLGNLKESTLDDKSENVNESLAWISLKQRFFNIGLIPSKPFLKGSFHTYTNQADTNAVKLLEAKVEVPVASLNNQPLEVKWYLGPNRYKELGQVAKGFEDNVYLGIPVVNLINKYLVVNIFYWLEDVIPSYAVIILVLVIIIRILLFPLNFKSYVGMAKMRVLQPQIAELKEKLGDDTMAIQQAQMKLYSEVGVNPLAGCLPLLLQLPVLLAMFNFFPNAIELRQQALWWAEDMSTYDSIATLPFSLPGYGNHVSLFTILMTASTLLLTWYNNKGNTMSASNQQMLVLSYVMPVFFMFILNSLPAGLNYYYLLSNMASFTQQVIIRSTVDDKAILAKLHANKERLAKKPKSSFSQRLEEAMKTAEEQRKIKAENKKKGGKA